MGTFADGIREGLRSAYCSQVAGSPQWFTNLRRVLVPNPLREGADNLYRWICNTPTAPALPDPPFTGGQCPGVGYNVFATRVLESITGCLSPQFVQLNPVGPGIVGPIHGLRRVSDNFGGGETGFIWFVDHGIPTQSLALGRIGTQFCPTAGYSGLVATRVDGQPDNCGDPGPDIPADPAPIDIDIDITYGPNNEYSLTVPVVLAPVFINVKGEVNVPVTVNLAPNFQITGNLEIFPGFEFSPSFPRGDDDGPITDPPPQNPTGPGTGDPEEPEEPPEEDPLIIGVLVAAVAQSEPRPSEIDQASGPSIFAPRLGTARFGKLIANQIFWSEDIPVKGLRSYVPCPFQFGADLVVVNAERGVGLSYSPVFSEPADWPPSLALGTDRLSDNRYPE